MSPEGRRSWAIVVPLALPGEKIRVRTYRQGRLHSYGDLLEVITPNAELRDDSRAQCKYFGSCAGCQYQVGFHDRRRRFDIHLFGLDAIIRHPARSKTRRRR